MVLRPTAKAASATAGANDFAVIDRRLVSFGNPFGWGLPEGVTIHGSVLDARRVPRDIDVITSLDPAVVAAEWSGTPAALRAWAQALRPDIDASSLGLDVVESDCIPLAGSKSLLAVGAPLSAQRFWTVPALIRSGDSLPVVVGADLTLVERPAGEPEWAGYTQGLTALRSALAHASSNTGADVIAAAAAIVAAVDNRPATAGDDEAVARLMRACSNHNSGPTVTMWPASDGLRVGLRYSDRSATPEELASALRGGWPSVADLLVGARRPS